MPTRRTSPPVRDDAAMMRAQGNWPCWPFLPIKKYEPGQRGGPTCSLLLAKGYEDGEEVKIMRGANLFSVNEWQGEPEIITIERVLQEGWIVD